MINADFEVFPHRTGIEPGEVLIDFIIHPDLLIGAKLSESSRYQNSGVVVFSHPGPRSGTPREIRELLDHGVLPSYRDMAPLKFDQHLQSMRAGGAAERLVRLQNLVELEAVGNEFLRVDLS